MDTSRRCYRREMRPAGFSTFELKIRETDLHIAVDEESFTPELPAFTEKRVLFHRAALEDYIARDPDFAATLAPHLVPPGAPAIALSMVRAGNTAGVGPMAAVAGEFAERIGRDLLTRVKQVIVENGGDIFLTVTAPVRVAVFAGASPFTGKIALEAGPASHGLGICTSSGTVGHSLSFGRADAAIIISPSTPLADAVATATGNRIQTPDDLPGALAFAQSIPGIEGILLIKDDKMAAWGTIKLRPL